MAGTYADAFMADYCFDGDLLTAAEEEHRKTMIFLGQAISQPEEVAVQLLAEEVAVVVPGFLGGSLSVPEEEFVEIVKAAMFSAMDICNDYRAEIDATIEFVARNLGDHGIAYLIHGNPRTVK